MNVEEAPHLVGCVKADRTGYLGGAETVIGVNDRFKPYEGRRGLHIPAWTGAGEGDASWRKRLPVARTHPGPAPDVSGEPAIWAVAGPGRPLRQNYIVT